MGKAYFCLLLIGVLVTSACNSNKQKEDSNVRESLAQENYFLGQKPPGLVPEVFAPGLVSTKNHERSPLFDPVTQEFYFLRQQKGEASKPYVIRFRDGAWQKPVLKEDMDHYGMKSFISTDGNKFYLGNEFLERTVSGWSEKLSLGPEYDQIPIMRLTSSDLDTYVFDERDPDGMGTLRYSIVKDGVRERPKAFGKEINTGKWTAHPFIAPDESYLIWDSEREGGYGDSDIYISFRQKDGSWGPAINMGPEINTPYEDNRGMVSHDGKYFFFNRIQHGETFEESEVNIFWVDARIIEQLKTASDGLTQEHLYFGQKPPGLIPEVFALRMISTTQNESTTTFSANEEEIYFRRFDEGLQDSALVAIQYKDNKWVETFVVPRGEISPDGKILCKGNEYREQTSSGWSELKSLGAPYDSISIMRLTASSKGTYYFDDISHFNDELPVVHIRYSRLVDGIREKPRTLNFDMGTTLQFHPFIAPDESYLIFDSRPENSNNDIYISFRQKDCSWGDAINLGDAINTELHEVYSSVTPDGKYFFFRRTLRDGTHRTMWVDTEFIDKLRPKV